MTIAEFAARIGSPLVIRYFPKDGSERNRWSAALAAHYYTSDTDRLVLDERHRERMHETGWGASPEAACEDLRQKLIDKPRKTLAWHAEHGREAERELADMIRRFEGTITP